MNTLASTLMTEYLLMESKINIVQPAMDRYQIISNVTNEVMWDWDLESNKFWWNDNYFNYLGYKKGESSESPESWKSGIHPEDKEKVLTEMEHFITSKQHFWSAEFRFLKANFSILNIYSRGNIFYKEAGSPIRIICSMQDITDRVKIEQELKKRNDQLHNLSAHLQQLRENEKISYAYQMHEQLGQELAGIHLRISAVIENISGPNNELKGHLSGINKILESSINKVRKLSSDLYPGILNDIGLIETLEWYNQMFSKEKDIRIEFTSDESEIQLPNEYSIVIYRIYQQALGNCIQHEATEIKCSMWKGKNILILNVIDNGKNFMKSEEIKSSIEFRAMEESLAFIKGSIQVEIDWKEGTHVMISLPFSQPD